MINRVENFLKKYGLLTPEKTFLVGFSGGFDSCVMLEILHKISKNCGFKLIALHLNHNWRGEESEKEAQNCVKFCEKRGIELIIEKLDPKTPKTETCAREARLKFFEKYYKKLNADGIFLAHTKSDNAETIIYRIARGTGSRGLCGIFEHKNLNGMEIFRPLLAFSRKEIENYCKTENLCPNNDSSNENTKYKRNFIRKKIIPLLKELNPEAENALAALSAAAVSEQNIINEYLEKIKKEINFSGKIDAEKYFSLSDDVKKRILLDLLVEMGLDYDSERISGIFGFLEENSSSKSGKTLSLAQDLWIFVSKKEIYTFSKREKCADEVEISDVGEYFLNGFELSVKSYDASLPAPEAFPDEHSDFIFCSNLEFPLTLRFRKNGDRIRPFGMEGSMKLKKLFINKNIPKNERESVILLCKNNEVLWAHGVCVNERLRAGVRPEYCLEIRKGGKNGQKN